MKVLIIFTLIILNSFFLIGNENEHGAKLGNENIDWINAKIYSSVSFSVKTDHDFAKNRIKEVENAREKAKVSFYSIFKQINFDESRSIFDFLEETEKKRNNLFSLIDRAKIHKMEYPNLNTVKVSYSINIYGNDSLLDLVMKDEDTLVEELPWPANYVYHNKYTGIIIDARGDLTSFDGFKTTIKPSIFMTVKDSSGKLVFSRYNVLPEVLKTKGMIRYSYDINEKLEERIGKNPYKLVAYGSGDRKGSIIVISENDAKKLLASEKTRKAIQNGNIVVVLSP